MDPTTLAIVITSFGIFAVFAGMFIWGVKTGQFKDVEEAKYRIFEQEDFEDEKKGEDESA